MKSLLKIFIPILFAICACNQSNDPVAVFPIIIKEVEAGNLKQAILLSDSVKATTQPGSNYWMKADSLSQIAQRIKIDYTLSFNELKARLEKIAGPVTDENIIEWDNKGWLDSRMIDGQKKYFKRSASNLMLLKEFHEKAEPGKVSEADKFRLDHTSNVLYASHIHGDTVNPVTIKIKYTITVEKDAVPDGETIRCWLPFPRSDQQRQKDIKLLATSKSNYTLAPDSALHSTLYMEEKSQKGKETVFTLSFSYKSYAQHFIQDSITARPYNTNSELYKKYTAEQLPHINFSPRIRSIADSICGTGSNPAVNVRKIWLWFKNNIPWTGAPEYSIINDIAGFTCRRMTGDCGMQTFLFMSMLRYKGIPVRWQSGWMVPPKAENLHDWCEVYYEGTGWVPVDPSYDLQDSENRELREFYLSGLDSYRLIVNTGVAGALFPQKKYLRSEPYDFQRGEVEWSGGNLYFDKWDYNAEIEYLPR
jgi:hypothetical protein